MTVSGHSAAGTNTVGAVAVPGGLAILAHAVADHLAAAEHHFLAVDGEVLLDFEEQVGVREADGVARRRAVEVRVLPAGKVEAHWASSFLGERRRSSGPLTALLSPKTSRRPASSISRTVLLSPGSNRAAVPAGMSSRRP